MRKKGRDNCGLTINDGVNETFIGEDCSFHQFQQLQGFSLVAATRWFRLRFHLRIEGALVYETNWGTREGKNSSFVKQKRRFLWVFVMFFVRELNFELIGSVIFQKQITVGLEGGTICFFITMRNLREMSACQWASSRNIWLVSKKENGARIELWRLLLQKS